MQVAFRHLPLVTLHPDAWRAGEAAECAARQGHFWSMHDALFASQEDLSASSITAIARQLPIDLVAFDKCMQGTATARVKEDADLAARLQFLVTPVFVVGLAKGTAQISPVSLIEGAQPIEAFRAVLDPMLAGARRLQNSRLP